MRGIHTNRMNKLAHRSFWKRADILATWLMIGMPLLVLVAAGLFFMVAEGLFPLFAIASSVCVLTLFSFRLFWRKWTSVRNAQEDFGIPAVLVDPAWSPLEQEVFQKSCARIKENTRELHNWDEGLFKLAFEVSGDVADLMSGGARGNLDITIPELLGLIDQAAGECREYLNKDVMFSILHGISVKNTLWVLRNRHYLASIAKGGDRAHKLFSLVVNPPVGAIRVFESLIVGNNTSYLSDQFQIELQRRILTYVAAKSIDLYSGRFKHGALPETGLAVVEPIRILLVGQTGAGKSSVAAAIAAPDTQSARTRNGESGAPPVRATIDGVQCVLIEAPGIDATARERIRFLPLRGSAARDAKTRFSKEFLDCDMVVWAIRADQPARKADVDFHAIFRESFGIQKWHRLVPPLLVAVTHVDRPPIIKTWPKTGTPSPAQMIKINDAVEITARNFEVDGVFPVKLDPPAWNVDELVGGIRSALPNACLAQSNRLRTAEGRKNRKAIRVEEKGVGRQHRPAGLENGPTVPDEAQAKVPGMAGRFAARLANPEILKKRLGIGKRRNRSVR